MTPDRCSRTTTLPRAPTPRHQAHARRPLARLRCRRHALAWAAASLLAAPAAQALDVFTANAPVYVGSWFSGSFIETQEFQHALDWAGWCSARAGAD